MLVLIENVQFKSNAHLGSPAEILRMVAFLVAIKSPLNVTDSCGSTPLHVACVLGLSEIVKFLISKGASLVIIFAFLLLIPQFLILFLLGRSKK